QLFRRPLSAVAMDSSTMHVALVESTFSKSQAGTMGFDISGAATGSLEIEASIFTHNRSVNYPNGFPESGGAILLSASGGSAKVSVANSFFSHDAVPRPRNGLPVGRGGAIELVSANATAIDAAFLNDTLVTNSVGGGGAGGGLFASGNVTASLKNV